MAKKKKNVVIDDDEYSVGTEVSEESTATKVEKMAPTGGKKKGKKGNSRGKAIDNDDDDTQLADAEEDVVSDNVFTGKKKSKSKKGSSGGPSKSSFELLGNDGDNDDIDANDDDILSDEDASVVTIDEKKSAKGSKKSASSFSSSAFDALNDEEDEDDDADIDAPAVSFTGKKKSSKKGLKKNAGGFSGSAFDALGDEEENAEEDEDDTPALSFSGKKKPSKKASKKSGKPSFSAFDALGDDEGDPESSLTRETSREDVNESDNDRDDAPISFSGKKKATKGKKNLDAYDEDKKADDVGDVDVENISFTGKKKKSSKSSKPSDSLFSAALLDDEGEAEAVSGTHDEDGDSSSVKFTGKKKSSKKKTGTSFAALGDEDEEAKPEDSIFSMTNTELNNSSVQNKEVPETSKSKKKKKEKVGRTAQEEDELDKLLAELGEAPATSKPEPASVPLTPAQEENDETLQQPADLDEQTADKEEGGGEGVVESAAAKKKRKKKEKEKEKKAAAKVEVKEDKPDEKKGKGGPKVPKHIREMQEAIQKQKEAEERRMREQEEKLRKEEEERKRLEELERQAEEARRRKKEREKEKLLKKKQEGKLLTGKQKEEQRRLEAMRNQFLASKGVSLPAQEVKEKTKRPIYSTKKSKAHHGQTNGAAPAKPENGAEEETNEQGIAEVESAEMEKGDVTNVVEKEEAPIEPKENGINVEEDDKGDKDDKDNDDDDDDDDDEWDAKSWDDADLVLPGKSAFEDEEIDTEPEDTVAKPAHDASSSTTVLPKKLNPTAETHSRPAGANREVPVGNKKDSSDSVGESGQDLRSPICCIMGHVDTGKTKLLDCIRGTNVQEGEAGGITQQIGATYFPAVNIRERTRELKADAKLNVPGLLVIDTPGHESFTNLRSRGSGLCDIAILVVDIMHGLEPQTIESLNLLKMRNTDFIIALNKIDRLYGWKTCRNAPFRKALDQQSKDVKNEFNQRLIQIITQFKEQGMNTELYYKNKFMGKDTFSIIPTSAISGEGIPDMLLLLVNWTQNSMKEKLTYSDEVQCTVLEVKVIEGHGTTIDVILVNGILHEGDQIVVCGMQGPIVASIRALLTPHPMKELRVKGTYLHHKEIKAAQGIKITAQGLEHAIAGTSLHVVGPEDDLEDIKAAAMDDVESVMSRIDKSGEGVYVQASTLGSLEALLEFLKSPAVKIPVSGIGIGPVHKKDVIRASVMLEKRKEYAAILAFDVKVTPEAREYADDLGVKVFTADIIYHLFDQFKAYIQNIKEEQKRESAEEAVFPCVLQIMPNCVFNKKDPIVLGVDILGGILKVGTPICVPSREFICIGKIASIENNHKAVDSAKKGHQVAIKIVGSNAEEQQKSFGRHFEEDDELVSQISRKSIDILKTNYREDLSMEDWRLVMKLKTLFKIQ